MNTNAEIIIALCSHLCADEGIHPLTPSEWSALAKELMSRRMEPSSLAGLSRAELRDALSADDAGADRLLRLLDRGGSLAFALNKLQSAGIFVVTRADDAYPRRLKKAFGNTCPPLFYYAGEPSLLDGHAVGYTGARSADEEDLRFTAETTRKTVNRGFCVVSGGARGVDTAAETAAVSEGGGAISFLADSMLRKIKAPGTVKALQDRKLLLLSAVNPDAGFHAGTAMMRNRYIYAQSVAAVVVRSDYNKGGTWSGAKENLKNQWAATLCWDNARYHGNQALIREGAIPVDHQWDGDVDKLTADWRSSQPEQISLFD